MNNKSELANKTNDPGLSEELSRRTVLQGIAGVAALGTTGAIALGGGIQAAKAASGETSNTNRENNVIWGIEGKIAPENKAAYIELMQEMVAETAKEAGALAYEWSLGSDNETIYCYDRYQDSDSAFLHLSQTWVQFQERYSNMVTITKFSVYSAVSDELRSQLAGLDPIYMQPIGGFAHFSSNNS